MHVKGSIWVRASQGYLVVKNPPASAGDRREVGSIPGLGRSPGGGHGNPLQYSCLENLMDRGAWWATVRRIVKRTQLSNLALMWDSEQEIMLRARATNLLNGSVYRSWCGPTEEVCVDLGDTGEP